MNPAKSVLCVYSIGYAMASLVFLHSACAFPINLCRLFEPRISWMRKQTTIFINSFFCGPVLVSWICKNMLWEFGKFIWFVCKWFCIGQKNSHLDFIHFFYMNFSCSMLNYFFRWSCKKLLWFIFVWQLYFIIHKFHLKQIRNSDNVNILLWKIE